ncbi:MAG: hypothetical protein Q8K05_05210 [Polaromonas sp.]|uniref:hypothetical protein n=1 Tax=Polaromonas sp. TaxID=1869339 RepID=UPI0027314F9E|nr:hypothetical protein [Polaromonas sp.]MDP2255448.1 hypothetical protein [Polaromonas sp.]
MSEEAVIELRQLREDVAALMACMLPYLSTDEMCRRYSCTPRTLNTMERDGRIPFRKAGRWNRTELMEWESKLT